MLDARHVWAAAVLGPVLAAALEVVVLLLVAESHLDELDTACEKKQTQSGTLQAPDWRYGVTPASRFNGSAPRRHIPTLSERAGKAVAISGTRYAPGDGPAASLLRP